MMVVKVNSSEKVWKRGEKANASRLEQWKSVTKNRGKGVEDGPAMMVYTEEGGRS